MLANALRMYSSLDPNIDQCACRSIAHSSYYAVYHLMAERFGVQTYGATYTGHEDMRLKLSAYVGSDSVILSAKAYFLSLWKLRVRADYKLHETIDVDAIEDALGWAEKVFRVAGITPAPS